MTTNPSPIPPPTPKDYTWDFSEYYEVLRNGLAANGENTAFASAIRLLAAERKQNAERGELLRHAIEHMPRMMYSTEDYVELVERARRAGVPV